MVYFTEHQNMLGKLTGRKEYRVEQAYKIFPEDKWLILDKNAPQELQDFMNTQWNVFLWQYSEMVHLKTCSGRLLPVKNRKNTQPAIGTGKE